MSVPEPASPALLQPSLRDAAPPQALLSERATFLTSFFGGPWAAVWMMAANFRRTGRLQAGLPVLGLAGLLGVVALGFTYVTITRPEWVAGWTPSGGRASMLVRRANNLLGLLAWGVCYLQLRTHYRAASLSGLDAARPWRTVLGAVLVAMGVHGAVVGLALVAR